MKIEYRQAVPEDADVIGEVHSLAWKQTYQGVFDKEYLDSDSPLVRREEFLRSLDDKHCVYLLIEVDDRAIGIAKLVEHGDEVEISSIYILEEYRGLGLGRKTLEYIFSEYKDHCIVLWVLEVNLDARTFYEKCGFKVTGKVRLIDRGCEFKQLMYQRSL